MKKIALIFGVTGQDGSYLADFLIKKGYKVHGVKRRSSSINTQRIDHIYEESHIKKRKFFLHYGDVTDSISVSSIVNKVKPDEIYNLAAQSHVRVSFDIPEYTADVTALGSLRILESLKVLKGLEKKIKIVKFIYFEHHYDNMIKKNYKFSEIHGFLSDNDFNRVFKIKMPLRKSFDYIYEKKTI